MSDKSHQDEEVDRTWQIFLELEIPELVSLHEANADDLQEAFSPTVGNLLQRLSQDDTVYQHPAPDESASSESSSSTSPEDTEATRMTFRFICEEFMTAPSDQRMGAFHTFLDRIWETANSRLRVSGEASRIADRNATLRQCSTVVKTMKEVIGSKFTNIQKYVKTQIGNRQESRPFADAPGSHQGPIRQGGVPLVPGNPQGRSGWPILPGLDSCKSGAPLLPGLDMHERGCPILPGAQYGKSSILIVPKNQSKSGFSIPMDQSGVSATSGYHRGAAMGSGPGNVPLVDPTSNMGHEPNLRRSGVADLEVSQVIRDCPAATSSSGASSEVSRTGVIVSNVTRNIQEVPLHSTLQSASPNRDPQRQSSPRRNTLRRQSNVEEDEDQ